MRPLFRQPAFWVLLVLLSLCGVGYAIKYFPVAFPVLTVDLKMDRSAALKQGRDVADRLQLRPRPDVPGAARVRETAAFNTDDDFQNYVELAAGGKDAFRQILKGDLYQPYAWVVRRYRERDKSEAKVFFTPAGKLYGFEETLPESERGAALSSDAALVLAKQAAADWGIDLSQYNAPEASDQAQPSGRVDHAFVFERPEKIGDARIQLTIGVSGDRVTQVSTDVKVPEAFTHRYARMRSVNETIWRADWYVIVALYLVGGCLVGLFFLLRQRGVLWRGALAAGVGVAFLQAVAAANSLPLQWMSYDTALSARTFLLTQFVVPTLREFFQNAFLFSLSFIAAESLTRRAFPNHIQVWNLWRRDVAASPQILGRTLGGYLVVGIDLAFVVAFYIFTAKHFGWWSPSEMLIDPNLPSNYFPWFTPVAQAFQAGSWEESMFRAIPLAGAALIGQRLGFRKTAIAVAFVLQALIFGAGHANYPVQPAYARLVELIVPASIFGLLYLRFGLLPAIIAHFFYDVVMMSLSLLASSLPGIWIDRTLLGLLAFLPLWIALWARWRQRGRAVPEAGPETRNAAWVPPAPRAAGIAALESAVPLPVRTAAAWAIAGLAGLALWLLFVDFHNRAPRLVVTRPQAEQIARRTLAERAPATASDASWTVLSAVDGAPGEDDGFVWRNGTPDQYHAVLGRFLDDPSWVVRFVRFQGDVEQRAEEYQVRVARHGEAVGYGHRIPEATPGASLPAAAARAKGSAALQARFGLDPATFRPVASTPTRQPSRVDWGFVYADPDPARYPLKAGEGRYSVAVRGDEPSSARGFVFIPDAWKRAEAERVAPLEAFSSLCSDFLLYGMCGALGAALVAWSLGRFSVRTFLFFFLGAFGLRLVQVVNNWPALSAQFTTDASFASQAFSGVGRQIVYAFFGCLSIGAAAGYFQALRRQAPPAGTAKREYVLVAGIALAWAGVRAATGSLVSLEPGWASYSELGTALPWLSAAAGRIVDILYTVAEFLWLFRVADLVARTRWGTAFLPGLVIIAGTTLYIGGGGIDALGAWLASGLGAGFVLAAAYASFFRLHRAWVPLAFGIVGAAGALKQAVLLAYPGAWGNLVGALLLVGIGWFWTRRLATGHEPV